MSNIRVSVQWEGSTVFAGEEVQCTITFKNVAPTYNSRSPSPITQTRRNGQGRDRWKADVPKQSTFAGSQNVRSSIAGPTRSRVYGHRSALSLSAPAGPRHGISTSLPGKVVPKEETANKRHKRSVSIISIGQDTAAGDSSHGSNGRAVSAQHQIRQHGRSASFQDMPRRGQAMPMRPSIPAHASYTNAKVPSPQVSAMAFAPSRSPRLQQRSNSRSPGDAFPPRNDNVFNNVPAFERQSRPVGSRSPSFRFPQMSPSMPTSPFDPYSATPTAPMANSMREEPSEDTHTKPTARVLSPVSMAGTPRSSMDFYTMSNNSSETLASEYVGPNPGRQPGRNGHSRQPSHLAPIISHTRPPETLMMGYVQLMGSFTLDGSLVNSAPFETVKRKGVIGGQGSGGVVGVDRPKKDGGLFGALGWSSIGESIGGLLGGSELSSIREMKGIANTNSVPIITTPQSILFVDLKLAPGESKSFWYTHTLPRGIPPTHKGRAMKISYQLVIGTQRAQSTAQQHVVKHVEVPFRVLAGVNGMRPFIIRCQPLTVPRQR